MRQAIDASRLFDDRPIARLQWLVFALAVLVNVLDGMDTQSIGVAAPFIAKELGFKVAAFGPVFSAALLGATVGAIVFGSLADQVGRKPLLVLSTLIIGVFTLATAHAPSREWLLAFRFLAGIGLGGATPCFIALTSEYAPARVRATWVTVMWAGFPLGATIGAFTNSALLPAFGWRAIFYLGGVTPLVLALVLMTLLPESLKYLALRSNRFGDARRLLTRLGVAHGDDVSFVADEERASGMPILHVLAEGRAVGTFLLWVPFFMGFGLLTVAVLWTPTLLRLNGISPAATAFVVAFNGIGGAIGQGTAGRLVERFGIGRTIIPSFVLGAFATVGLGYGASSVPLAATFIGLNGLFFGMATGGTVALAAAIYPTAVRSTGVGLAMAAGRFGQVVSPLITGELLGLGLAASQIMLIVAVGGLIGAVFVILFQKWTSARVAGDIPVLDPAATR